ncbi:hypothetical protein C4D60_Mb07t16400 [Musa balbisiana]|uniref:Uncharacterized protein n=1 Tax=Musa balbisiana TaxID=52838 RepID=A0A4S8JGG1_MUSBA|nr:hypothetical protein C4D60_Mb07t16400 [Musa balbisiana]
MKGEKEKDAMHDLPEKQIRGKVVLPVIHANHQTSDVNMNSEETMSQLPTLRDQSSSVGCLGHEAPAFTMNTQ